MKMFVLAVFIFATILMGVAVGSYAGEQRCTDLGANCICSEPLNTSNLVRVEPSYYNPGDSTTKECNSESFSNEVFRGAAIVRNGNDLTMSNSSTILNALPTRQSVNFVLKGPQDGAGLWFIGENATAFSDRDLIPNARVSFRFYRYYSSDYQFDRADSGGNPDNSGNGTCNQSTKISEHWTNRVNMGGAENIANFGFGHYNYLDWTPATDCCHLGGPFPGTRASMKGKWWFLEIVQTKLAGPGYNLQVYVRNVTDNGPERKVVDLQSSGLPGSPNIPPPIQTLTPPKKNPSNNFSGKVLAFMANQYREVNPGSATPVCRGFTAISHYMLAGWTIDAGQRIGPASEIEGGSGTPIPLR